LGRVEKSQKGEVRSDRVKEALQGLPNRQKKPFAFLLLTFALKLSFHL
jgi:hypothetical protein